MALYFIYLSLLLLLLFLLKSLSSLIDLFDRVDFSHDVRKLDPCRVEMFANFGCFGAADGTVRRKKPDANFNFKGFWSAELEVIGGCVSLAAYVMTWAAVIKSKGIM